MSERVRNTVIASLAGSKKIIVAACAAIAMFLGAVSAGATMFDQNRSKSDAGMSSVFQPSSATDQGQVSTENSSDPILTQQQPLTSQSITLQSSSLYEIPGDRGVSMPKKNAVSEVLKSVTNAAVFQNQAGLLDKLQTKTADPAANTLTPIVTPANPVVEVVVPSADPGPSATDEEGKTDQDEISQPTTSIQSTDSSSTSAETITAQ